MINNINKPVLLRFFTASGIPHMISDNFKSVSWARAWTGVGDFRITLTIPTAADYEELKQCAFVCINNDVRYFGVINKIEEDYSAGIRTVLVTGTELKGLANKRICLEKTTINNTPAQIAKSLLNYNLVNPSATARGLGSFTQSITVSVDETGVDSVDCDAKYATLSDKLKNIAETYDFGWYCNAVLTDGAITGFRWYIASGKDRTITQSENEPLVLSFQQDTLDDMIYSENINSTTNTAIIGGTGEGADRTIAYVNNSNSGIKRNETYVEARTQKTTSTLQAKGKEALAKYGTDSITTITPSVLLQNRFMEKQFDLGDVGTLRVHDDKELRLTKVTEIYEKDYAVVKMEYGIQNNSVGNALSKLTNNYANLLQA